MSEWNPSEIFDKETGRFKEGVSQLTAEQARILASEIREWADKQEATEDER